MTSRQRQLFEDDCDAYHYYEALREVRERDARERLYALLRAGRKHFPYSRRMGHAWVRARLALGDTRPRVLIGSGAPLRFPRTMREAVFL